MLPFLAFDSTWPQAAWLGLRRQFNPLNAELNPIYHLLVLLEGATTVDVRGLRVKL